MLMKLDHKCKKGYAKMKRLFCVVLTLLVLICLLPRQTLAAEISAAGKSVVYFEDGSYIVTTAEEISTRASGTKSLTKARTYYGSDDEIKWEIILTGTFTYNGTSATCTSSSCSVDVYANNWYVVSKSAKKSGNEASCTVTMGQTFLGITISKPVHTLTITCDKDGNLT